MHNTHNNNNNNNNNKLSFTSIALIVCVLFLLLSPLQAHAISVREAREVLQLGNITRFLTRAFSITRNFTVTINQTRHAASAQLRGCVNGTRFRAVANSTPFLNASIYVRSVSECLAFCAAQRRLDYWVQTYLPSQAIGQLPVLELAAAIDTTSRECWCLPRNMTTVEDVELWHQSAFGTAAVYPQSCCDRDWTPDQNQNQNQNPAPEKQRQQKAVGRDAASLETFREEAAQFLPLGGSNIFTGTRSQRNEGKRCDAASAGVNTSKQRQQLSMAIFSMEFACGLTNNIYCSPGCMPVASESIPYAAYKPCLPMEFDDVEKHRLYQEALDRLAAEKQREKERIIIIVVVAWALCIAICVIYVGYNRYKKKQSLDRIAGLVRGASSPLNVANFSGHLSTPLIGEAGGNGENSDAATAGAARVLAALPSHVLSTRSLREAQSLSQLILTRVASQMESGGGSAHQNNNNRDKSDRSSLQRAVAEEPLPQLKLNRELAPAAAAASAAPSSSSFSAAADLNHSQDAHQQEDCPICLEDLHDAPQHNDDMLAALPECVELPQCKHRFHTLCIHRQICFEAQNSVKFDPTCAVCGALIVALDKSKK